MKIELTEEQLNWLKEHPEGAWGCCGCPLGNDGDYNSCSKIPIGTCKKTIKYAIENATILEQYKRPLRPSRLGKTGKWVHRVGRI